MTSPVTMYNTLGSVVIAWHDYKFYFVSGFVALQLVLWWFRRPSATAQSVRSTSPATEEKTVWLERPLDLEPEKIVGVTALRSQRITDTRKPRTTAPRVVAGKKPVNKRRNSPNTLTTESQRTVQPVLFFSSLTGSTQKLAERVKGRLERLSSEHQNISTPIVHDLSYVELDDYFVSGPKADSPSIQNNKSYFYALLIPSYDVDTILATFLEHLKETHHDFRIDTAPLSSLLGYTVFGIGDREGWPTEESGFCSQAIEVDKWLAKLTARKRAYPLGLGDVKSDLDKSLEEWSHGLCATLVEIESTGSLGEGVPGSGDAVESDEEAEEDVPEQDEFPDSGRQKRQKTENLIDVEDVGGRKKTTKSVSSFAPIAVDFTTYSDPNYQPELPNNKAMVPASSPTYASLTKQGYTIIGSHSGVKICRWTKSALRGRGSCYKNSFYGIASHLCMETTPSLSCSNKCVFCWRHGTNPVSTTWKWQVDPPDMIFAGAKKGHYQKIKMMKGVPGVRADRFEEAMRIRHCALSLVGEPIFYPRINEYLDLLHGEHISTFLVCNAQHPAQLEQLTRVTQLYVSIDASNKESLRKIDRPLHRDFWERFQQCLSILHSKRLVQRTVFRLTLVKGFNMADEVPGYADLIEQGLPCFIEIKGVTYCGTSTSGSAGLTMQNVPFYDEIKEFVNALDLELRSRNIADIDGGYGYGIAAEHAHSCCVLLASKRFHINEKWHTRINYDKFFELLEREKQTGANFGPEDYCRETEDWALWGNGGFDPRDERVDRKGRPKQDANTVAKKVVEVVDNNTISVINNGQKEAEAKVRQVVEI